MISLGDDPESPARRRDVDLGTRRVCPRRWYVNNWQMVKRTNLEKGEKEVQEDSRLLLDTAAGRGRRERRF